MTNTKSVPQEFLDRQVELLNAGDTAGLAERYAEDATFARFDRVAHGRQEIRELFDYYITEKPTISTMDAIQITDDLILYQAAEEVNGQMTTAVGTLAFKNGQVWRQTVAFVVHRPI
ncbi:MAG TPA: ketosteroid isomerase family protein [Pseudonocardiaceae bacterium]|jgi:ketosteroid isomerase-like protein